MVIWLKIVKKKFTCIADDLMAVTAVAEKLTGLSAVIAQKTYLDEL